MLLQRAMACCGISIPSPSHHHPSFLIVQNLSRVPSSRPTPKKPSPPLSTSPCSSSSSSSSLCTTSSCRFNWRERLPAALGRRMTNLSIVGFVFFSKALASEELLELGRYTDSKEGFTLLVPSSWIKVDKAGATVLFEDANKKANNVGVVVSPTRISSLGEFGTPQFVADKLIQAERRKVHHFHFLLLIVISLLFTLVLHVGIYCSEPKCGANSAESHGMMTGNKNHIPLTS